jgi:hypothetical protein
VKTIAAKIARATGGKTTIGPARAPVMIFRGGVTANGVASDLLRN